jgi:hypothetical protein
MSASAARSADRIAALGLLVGARFGIAGTLVGSPTAQASLWAIDAIGLVVATGHSGRTERQCPSVRCRDRLMVGGAGPRQRPETVPVVAAAPRRRCGVLIHRHIRSHLFWRSPVARVGALPFCAYPVLVATLLGWARSVVREPA